MNISNICKNACLVNDVTKEYCDSEKLSNNMNCMKASLTMCHIHADCMLKHSDCSRNLMLTEEIILPTK